MGIKGSGKMDRGETTNGVDGGKEDRRSEQRSAVQKIKRRKCGPERNEENRALAVISDSKENGWRAARARAREQASRRQAVTCAAAAAADAATWACSVKSGGKSTHSYI